MTINEYQQLAQRTSATTDSMDKFTNGCLGAAGEAGECAEICKKVKYHGHQLDRVAFVEEIGDLLWYCAEMAASIGVDLDTIAAANLQKLYHRYPERFDSELSIHRDKDADTEAVREAMQ